jgi:molybdopterin synthase sulfur carrier subunit
VRESGGGRVIAMRFHLPSALRRWAGGNEIVEIGIPADARMTVGEAFVMLGRDYPAVRQRVLDDQNDIRRHVNVFVDGENVRYMQGAATQVSNDTEIWVYPALSGGCDCRSCAPQNDYRAAAAEILRQCTLRG